MPTVADPAPSSNVLSARLLAVESKLDNLFETAPFSAHTLGKDGTYSSINAVGLFWLGETLDNLIGKKKPRDFLTPQSQTKLDQYTYLHGRYGFTDLELELVDKLGAHRPISMTFSGIATDSDYTNTARFIAFDMTAIQLRRNLQQMAAMSFESHCGISVTDTSGTVIRVNNGFSTLTGYTSEDIVGKNMHLMSSGVQPNSFYEAMWRSILAVGHWQGEIRNRRKDGHHITLWLSIAAIRDVSGVVTNYVGTFYDITSAKAGQDEVTRMALHDPLTLLPNRRLLQQRIEHTLALANRNGLHSALLFLDLDHFKSINDTKGHEAGDLVLLEAGRRMQRALRDGDTVARVGGDEFVVLLEGIGTTALDAATQARNIGEKLLKTLAEPYHILDFEFRCTASIGIEMVNFDDSAAQLLIHADLAMYQAKKSGRNALQFFDPQMQLAANHRSETEQDLQRALDRSEFALHYQPQVDLQATVTGVEALLRWNHPKRGMVAPGEFIPLAEESGLIIPIGAWVLSAACKQLKQWSQHAATCKLTIAVNVSARQFAKEDFVATVLTALNESGAAPALLELEVTESMVLDVDNAIAKMQALKELGIRFSLDDFGTGYSSLSNLTRLPISKLKIDQSFVRNMALQPGDQFMVQTIVGMAHNLGLSVIAEGVETQSQREQLESYTCEMFQGYLYGKAQLPQEIERLIGAR